MVCGVSATIPHADLSTNQSHSKLTHKFGIPYITSTNGYMHETQLYFLAIIPPQPIFDEVLQFKQYFATHHNSKAALKSPPHITLHMPFKWQLRKEEQLIDYLNKFNPSVADFNISLKNFDCFEPRVIFVDVLENKNLRILQKELSKYVRRNLKIQNADYKDRGFHPHMTVAFRDLKKTEFKVAWEKFNEEKYNADFKCDGFTLLKHNGKHWSEFRKWPI